MKLYLKQRIDKYSGRFIIFFILGFVRLGGKILRRNHSIAKHPHNILVIKILGIGSVLMAADSIYSIKKQYPQARIVLLTSKSVGAGVKPIQLFDDMIVLNDENIFSLFVSSISCLLKCWKLPKLWLLDLEVYSVLTTVFAVFTMARNRFGFQLNKVHFRNYLNTHNVYFNQFIPAYINYHNIAKAMGVKTIATFQLPFGKSSLPRKYIAINNTCSELGGHLRKMPDDKMFETCTYMLQKYPNDIVFTGAPSDFDNIGHFINTYFPSNERVQNIAGKLTFDEYYQFLGTQCRFMITIDSAPFHMAVKLNLPTISLWGPINPSHRFDFNNQTRHLYYSLYTHCSPCIHHTDIVPCNGNNFCMKNMEAERLKKMIDQQFENTADA